MQVAFERFQGQTLSVKKLRAIFVLLLSLALPCAATANMLDGMRCHHDGLGALVQDEHAGHGAMHMHHGDHQKAAGGGCDCPVKCSCQHHCAGGGCAAALGFTPIGVDFAGRSATIISAYRGVVSDPQLSFPFRPPIAAPRGAA